MIFKKEFTEIHDLGYRSRVRKRLDWKDVVNYIDRRGI